MQQLMAFFRRRKWQPTPVFLPEKSHGQGSLADYSPWGHKELDTTEQQTHLAFFMGFPSDPAVKESACNTGAAGDADLIPGWERFPWRRKWQPTPVFLPGDSHGQRSLAGYSPQELSTHTHTWSFLFTSSTAPFFVL